MYVLEVRYPKKPIADHVERIPSAADAMARISALLKEHEGCEKIVVYSDTLRLFSVDCQGNTTPG